MVGWAVCCLLCLPLSQGGHGLRLGPESPGSFLTCPPPPRLGRPDSWPRGWAGSPSWGARYEVLCMVLVSVFGAPRLSLTMPVTLKAVASAQSP